MADLSSAVRVGRREPQPLEAGVLREYLRNIRLFSRNARLLVLATFIGALGMGMVGVLRNLYLQNIHLTDQQIGNTLSGNAIGILAVTIPAAVLMDRLRLKGFLLTAGLLGSLGLVGQLFTHSFAWILFFSFLMGVGASFANVSGAPFVMRNTGPSERVYLFGVSIAVATLGSAISMWISMAVTAYLGDSASIQRQIMLVGAGVSSLSAIPLLLIQEAPVQSTRTPVLQWFRQCDWRSVGRLCLPEFFIGCGAGLTIPFIQMYFRHRFGSSSGQINNYYACSQIVNVVGFLAAPVIARRLGLVKSVVTSQLLSIPFFAVLAVTTDLRLAVGAVLMRNMLMNMAGPVSSNFAMEIVPEGQRAITNCLKNVSWIAPWVFTTSLAGYLLDHFSRIWPWPGRFGVQDGFSLAMGLTITSYLIAAATFYSFFHRHRAAERPARVETRKFVPAVGAADAE